MMKFLNDKNMYWIGMKSDLSKMLQACSFCQTYKKDNQIRNPPMQITSTALDRFDTVSLDIVDMQKKPTSLGNKWILSIQDHFSKWICLYTLKNHTAGTVPQHLLHYVCLYDIPKTILTDQGTEFKSQLLHKFYEQLKIQKVHTSAYHPETNGPWKEHTAKLRNTYHFLLKWKSKGMGYLPSSCCFRL